MVENSGILLRKGIWTYSDFNINKNDEKDILADVILSGICGSDIHRIKQKPSIYENIALGHEMVVDSGNKIYVVNPIVNCGKCKNCLSSKSQFCEKIIGLGKTISGSFAKKVYVPSKCLYELSMKNIKLGCLVDSVAVSIHSIKKTNLSKNQSVLIIGDGTLAATTIATLKLLYPGINIYLKGKHLHNINYLKEIYGVSSEEVEDSSVDCAFETVGGEQSDTLNYAVSKSKVGASIVILGVYPEGYSVEFNARSAFYKELSLIGANSFVVDSTNDDFQNGLDIIANNENYYSPIITHEVLLEDFDGAMNILKHNKQKEPVFKVLLTNKKQITKEVLYDE